LLNKDGGVFNTPNINESQQTGFKNVQIDVPRVNAEKNLKSFCLEYR
jgi:hypothetical protein